VDSRLQNLIFKYEFAHGCPVQLWRFCEALSTSRLRSFSRVLAILFKSFACGLGLRF
jgi:hypothetical protein